MRGLVNWFDARDLSNLMQWLGSHIDDQPLYVVSALLGGLSVVTFVGVTAILNIWLERRLIGRFQVRRGPNRVGPFGLLQPVADALKLIQKEVLTPRAGDRILFLLAPVAVFPPAMLVFGVLPWGRGMSYVDLNVGVLFVLSVSSVATIAVFMAGWSSNNKYALFGAMRVIAMLISYEIPVVLALLGPVLFAQSMSLNDIVLFQREQHLPLVLFQPLAFGIYLLAATAELNRTPADIAEAESEIVAGYHTEYSGMKFGLFYAVELISGLAVSAILASLFFGGWWLWGLDQWVPGWVIFVTKIYLFYFVFIWLRGTLPRLRIDQLMGLAWKYLLPLSLLNLLLAGLEVTLRQQYAWPAEVLLPSYVGANLVVSALLAVGLAWLLGARPTGGPRRARLVREVGVVLAPQRQ